MSLMTTHLDRYGIVMATDSNLTDTKTGHFVRASAKNFPLDCLPGCVSVVGGWNVGAVSTDEWMCDFIVRPETWALKTLDDFAASLYRTLPFDMTPEQRASPTIVHIAGYVPDPVLMWHPVHWTISNVDLREGEYYSKPEGFALYEDFWVRDCRHKDSPTGFDRNPDAHYSWQVYANGHTPGRIVYMTTRGLLEQFFACIWSIRNEPHWRFHPPRSLEESATFVQTYMSIVRDLFKRGRLWWPADRRRDSDQDRCAACLAVIAFPEGASREPRKRVKRQVDKCQRLTSTMARRSWRSISSPWSKVSRPNGASPRTRCPDR